MKLPGRLAHAPVFALLFLALLGRPALAQVTGTITGTVSDATSGRPLETAQVLLPQVGQGGLSNQQGRFLLVGVPAGEQDVQVELIGYTTQVQRVTVEAGGTTAVEILLEPTALRLQELVVTGVAAETPRVKLPFTVERMDFVEMPVPSPSAEGLLQGKVPGVKIVSGSGAPGDESDILLRGPTSITGSQAPLVIVDGVVTDNTLADISALDVESVEVVKGAAASSLYGSRAANGVVQISTRRGSDLGVDESRIIVRNELGIQELVGRVQLSRFHPYRTDESGNILDPMGNVTDVTRPGANPALSGGGTAETAFQDKAYPARLYDHIGALFDPGEFYTNHVAVEGRTGSANYRVSLTNQREQGVVDNNDGFKLRSFRLNLDHAARDNLNVSLSTYYSKSRQDAVPLETFRGLTFMGPHVNLAARDEDGRLAVNPDPLSNETNPLYPLENQDLLDERQRFMVSGNAVWSPLSWFDVEANYSMDRFDFHRTDMIPLGYERADSIGPHPGSLFKSNIEDTNLNGSVTASFHHAFGDLTVRTNLRYLMEDRHREGFQVLGEDFAVASVPSLSNVEGDDKDISSDVFDIVSEGYFLITALDYRGKYVGDFLVRRDGSSLFGPEERWHTYHRASAAWRLAQEPWWNVGAVDELKLRYSIGTAGGRPRFSARYETYFVSGGIISPVTLGNPRLKPELAMEQELGLETVVLGRVSAGVTYAWSKVEDQLLDVPLPAFNGFTSQWRNAGTLESNTVEGYIEAALVDRPDLGWSTRLNYDRTRQWITHLNLPPYRRGFFYIREGEPMGTFYGARFASACSDLTSGTDCGLFDVNDDGFLVYVGEGITFRDGVAKGLWGTMATENGTEYQWGFPVVVRDADGTPFVRLGSTTPTFNLSWSNTLRWGNFSLYALLDGEFGADLYNETRQFAYRDGRSREVDQDGKPEELKKPVAYYSVLYNGNENSSWFVEDGTYVKLREASLRYTLDQARLDRWLGSVGIRGLSVTLIGRNLRTWTHYKGYDPEVGFSGESGGGSIAIGRVDTFQYPNFRTLTASLEIVF